eukprot:TRINITY_DN297_c0_g1_i1.p1 TRINITY_DN297_c0_g1~~TRINITY_DN297_c0_g1_i1.p1  ORF type:complete len:392 (+),score=106.30 TRINITY_DN297_c0_g1_i1:165-1178(+)
MKATVVLVVLAGIVAVAFGAVQTAESRSFFQFIKKYNKSYASTEFQSRFVNFKASLARIAAANAKSQEIGGATYGVTKFADLSVEEFKSTILMKNPITQDKMRLPGVETLKPRIKAVDAPAAFDWRPLGAVTPVKDQEQCGSCWAFSATETIESTQLVNKVNDFTNLTLALAPQQIVDCDTVDQGCNGGNTPTAYQYVIGAGGMENETTYPYQGQDGQCAFQKSDVVASISGFKYATSAYNENTLKANLVSWQPVSICVDASAWQDYQSGVMTWEECAFINVLDHCVQLVGYDTTAAKPYWIVRNSWNTNWGIDGYIWLEMGHDTCGLAHEATVPTL